MDTTISLYTMMLAMICGLIVLALAVRIGTQRHEALAWLAAALGVGALNTWLFAHAGTGMGVRMALYVCDPLTLYALAQAVRLAIGERKSPPLVALAMATLAAVSVAFVASGAPVAIEAIPAMLAGVIAYLDAFRALVASRRSFIRDGLVVSIGVLLMTDLVRLPFFPGLLEGGTAFPGLAPSWLPEFLLITSSFAVPATCLFIIAAVVSRVIGTYRDRSERDGLTDLFNRRSFTDAVRNETPSVGVLVVADIDHFKSINDGYGHSVGDDVIRHFARLMQDASPLAARLGGEEFVVALPGRSLKEAETVAERLREAFASTRLPALSSDHRLSASFGLAPYTSRLSLAESLDRADRALYRAKRQGRNCVAIFGTDQREKDSEKLLKFG